MTKRTSPPAVPLPCAACGTVFLPRDPRNKYCSENCRYDTNKRTFNKEFGPCPTCGNMFKSRAEKVFCSQTCYINSPQFKAMTMSNIAKNTPNLGVPRVCKGCGSEFSRARRAKFCSTPCRRKYFAERFDRWVANPEQIALPQNFDEYLSQTVMACPISGCDWKGPFLGAHVNFAHGITARDFKILCGFNLTTGLVGTELFASMSAHVRQLIEKGLMSDLFASQGFRPPLNTNKYISLERLERARKQRAELPRTSGVDMPCRMCGKATPQPSLGRRLYCSTTCRSKWYTTRRNTAHGTQCTCAFCGKAFMGTSDQAVRVSNGGQVCCSAVCRNRFNGNKRRKTI